MGEMKNETECIMVCVTPQEACLRLIAAGARAASESEKQLKVISVFRKDRCLDTETGNALDKLFEYAKEYNADMNVYFSDDAFLTVAVAAKKLNVSSLIMGFPKDGSSGFIEQVHELLPKIPITMIDENSNEYKIIHFDKKELKRDKISVH